MEAIRELQAEGYTLTVDGDTIRYRLRDGMEPEKEKAARLLAELKEYKAEAISFLRACHDKGQSENVDCGPDMRTITVFSRVLNREVFVSWQGDNPQSVLFDGVAYTIDEIVKLREMPLTSDDLRTIHLTKKAFEGEIEVAQDLTNYE